MTEVNNFLRIDRLSIFQTGVMSKRGEIHATNSDLQELHKMKTRKRGLTYFDILPYLYNDKTYFAHYSRKAKSYACRTFTRKTFKRGLTDFVIIPYLFRSLFHYGKKLRMSHILFKQGIFLILRRSSALENCTAVWLSRNNNPNFCLCVCGALCERNGF